MTACGARPWAWFCPSTPPGDPIPPDGTVNIAQAPKISAPRSTPRSWKEIRPSSNWRLSFPQQGPTDRPMAASDKMWVVLKIYAADGENGLHPHPNEDHTFVVLQGEAKFYGRTTRHARSARTKAYCYTRYVLLVQSDERGTTGDGAYRRRCVRRGRPSRPH